MRWPIQKHIVATGIFVVGIFVGMTTLASFFLSPHPIQKERVEPGKEQKKSDSAKKDDAPSTLLDKFVASVINFIENHEKLFVAAGTIVIAAFTAVLAVATGFLYRVTKIAAIAARDSANTATKALTDLERPYIFVFGVAALATDPSTPGGMTPFIRFSVANYGKTPAIVEQAMIGFDLTREEKPEIPLTIDFGHDLALRPILQASERRDDLREPLPEGVSLAFGSSDGVAYRVSPKLEPNESLFFWAIIRYRGPFTTSHERSAAWWYDRVSHSFVQLGGDE